MDRVPSPDPSDSPGRGWRAGLATSLRFAQASCLRQANAPFLSSSRHAPDPGPEGLRWPQSKFPSAARPLSAQLSQCLVVLESKGSGCPGPAEGRWGRGEEDMSWDSGSALPLSPH